MNAIYAILNQSPSMLNIEFQAERALATAEPEDQVRLKQIIAAPSLDEAHALIAEALGDQETADAIRAQRIKRLSKLGYRSDYDPLYAIAAGV